MCLLVGKRRHSFVKDIKAIRMNLKSVENGFLVKLWQLIELVIDIKKKKFLFDDREDIRMFLWWYSLNYNQNELRC